MGSPSSFPPPPFLAGEGRAAAASYMGAGAEGEKEEEAEAEAEASVWEEEACCCRAESGRRMKNLRKKDSLREILNTVF